METLSVQEEMFGAQVTRVQYRFVGQKVKKIGVQLNCKPYMNTIDQEHRCFDQRADKK